MKKKLAKLEFNEISNEIPVLSHSDLSGCKGGGDGSRNNPYTSGEASQLMDQGRFTGGYVYDQYTGEISAFAPNYNCTGDKSDAKYSPMTAGDFYDTNKENLGLWDDATKGVGVAAITALVGYTTGAAIGATIAGTETIQGAEQAYRRDAIHDFMTSDPNYDPNKKYYYHTERNLDGVDSSYTVEVWDSETCKMVSSSSFKYLADLLGSGSGSGSGSY